MSFNTTLTPNGTGILFCSHSPRGYWIHRAPVASPADLLDDPPKRSVKDGPWGERLDSVTGALGVLDKPALPWWGMGVGISGVLQLVAMGKLSVSRNGDAVQWSILDQKQAKVISEDEKLITDVQRLSKLLTLNKLTVNHVRDDAGTRGRRAHEAFEMWAETGVVPDPSVFPEDQREYVEGLIKFFAETTLSHVSTEVMVASREHRYGGRYDIRAKMTNERYGFRGTPSITDLKTSKRVYVSHFLQMEGYENAGVEGGWKPSEVRAVIHCADGDYKIVRSEDVAKDGKPCTSDDFLAALRLKRVVDRLGGL